MRPRLRGPQPTRVPVHGLLRGMLNVSFKRSKGCESSGAACTGAEGAERGDGGWRRHRLGCSIDTCRWCYISNNSPRCQDTTAIVRDDFAHTHATLNGTQKRTAVSAGSSGNRGRRYSRRRGCDRSRVRSDTLLHRTTGPADGGRAGIKLPNSCCANPTRVSHGRCYHRPPR